MNVDGVKEDWHIPTQGIATDAVTNVLLARIIDIVATFPFEMPSGEIVNIEPVFTTKLMTPDFLDVKTVHFIEDDVVSQNTLLDKPLLVNVCDPALCRPTGM